METIKEFNTNSKNLIVKEVKSKERKIEVLQKGNPYDFHLGYLCKTKHNTTVFYNSTAELFNKFNAIGLLSDVLEDKNLDFNTMLFVLKGKKYKTTREQFLENGIRETFYFGEKIFLPLIYFQEIIPDQISMNLESQE